MNLGHVLLQSSVAYRKLKKVRSVQNLSLQFFLLHICDGTGVLQSKLIVQCAIFCTLALIVRHCFISIL